jgi:hypothetical protein
MLSWLSPEEDPIDVSGVRSSWLTVVRNPSFTDSRVLEQTVERAQRGRAGVIVR